MFSTVSIRGLMAHGHAARRVCVLFSRRSYSDQVPPSLGIDNEAVANGELKVEKEDVLVVGSGPAAYTASVYLGRALLSVAQCEGLMAGGVPPGGQLMTTTHVENYPPFPLGIQGPDLMDRFRQHALASGRVRLLTETVSALHMPSTQPSSSSSSTNTHPFWARTEDGRVIRSRAVLLATGATARRLHIPGEAELWNKGVSACAVCDGALPMFRARPVAVVGGGDSACEEALFLSRYASTVYLLVRRDRLRASRIMQTRLFAQSRVRVLWQHTVEEVIGDQRVRAISVRDRSGELVEQLQEDEKDARHEEVVAADRSSGQRIENAEHGVEGVLRTLDVAGLFYAVGHLPNTAFLNGQIELDEDGFIVSPPGRTNTSVPGVFAAGDVLMDQKPWRQAITAAGSGCAAALQTIDYLDQA